MVERYPKVPHTLLVKLSTVEDNDCDGLSGTIRGIGDDSPYESMTIPWLSTSSCGIRTPSPIPLVSHLPSSSYVPSDIVPSLYSLPYSTAVFRPISPILDNSNNDIVCTGSLQADPATSDVDIKPKVSLSCLTI